MGKRLMAMAFGILATMPAMAVAQTGTDLSPEEAAAVWVRALNVCLAADDGGPLPACRRALKAADVATKPFGDDPDNPDSRPLAEPLHNLVNVHEAVALHATRRRAYRLMRNALGGWVLRLLDHRAIEGEAHP